MGSLDIISHKHHGGHKKQTKHANKGYWHTGSNNNETINTEYGSRFISVDNFGWAAACKMQMSLAE